MKNWVFKHLVLGLIVFSTTSPVLGQSITDQILDQCAQIGKAHLGDPTIKISAHLVGSLPKPLSGKKIQSIQVLPTVIQKWGLTPFTVHVEFKDGESARHSLSVRLKLFKNVLIANQSIAKTKIFTPHMATRQLIDVTYIYGKTQFLDRSDQLAGYRASQFIPKGKWLDIGMVEPIPIVGKNKQLIVSAQLHGIKVTYVGISLEEGNEGEIISFRNPRSNEIFMAKIRDATHASVIF